LRERAVPDRGIELAQRLVHQAQRLGFDAVGIARPQPARTIDRYQAWLDRGYHGKMAFLARPDSLLKRGDLALVLPEIRSVVTLVANYHTNPLDTDLQRDPSRGIIASYAWGADYHHVIAPRLRELGRFVLSEIEPQALHRAYVDTGPLLERELAAASGLGFIGKNTNLIRPGLGSWLFLAELLLTAELAETKPSIGRTGTCGSCTRCLDACPTNAFVAPYILDARRCISYLTIELKSSIPRELRPLLGNRVFGCDVCQQLCPWNRRYARPTTEPAYQPRAGLQAPPLLELIALDEEGFRVKFQNSPVERARRRGLLRNTAVALGNWGHPRAVPALTRALCDREPLVRGHAAWALGRIATHEACRALRRVRETETDVQVLEELDHALCR
jgi:epoxyqueuosine reductase